MKKFLGLVILVLIGVAIYVAMTQDDKRRTVEVKATAQPGTTGAGESTSDAVVDVTEGHEEAAPTGQ